MSKRQRKSRDLVFDYGESKDEKREEWGVSYHRISDVSQLDGYSLSFQRDKTTAMAEKLKVVVPDEWAFDEVAIGADDGRPKYGLVWELVGSGKVRHVFVYDTSRLARDPLHVGLFLRHCRDNGVALHFGDGGTVEGWMDEVIQYLKGSFAQQERERIIERTMDGKVKAANANQMPNGCGPGIYGYDYDKDKKIGKRTINVYEAWVVRQIYEWRLAGVSCCEIVRRLNNMGIPSKRGGKWSAGVVRTMLRNEAYTGVQWWGKKRHEKVFAKKDGAEEGVAKRKEPAKRKVTAKPAEEWIRLEGFSPKIIEPWLYRAVQEAMDSNPRRGVNWLYVLTDFFICGECGSSVCGSTQYWNDDIYPYYRCSGTMPSNYRPKVCDQPGKRADRLELAVLEPILALAKNPAGIVRDLRRMLEDGGAEIEQRKADLIGKVKKHRVELGTLTLQRTKEIIDQDMYESLCAPINNLLAGLEKEIAGLADQERSAQGWARLEERVQAAFANIAKSLDELDDEGLQRLLRLLNIKITGGPGRVLVTGLLDPSLVTIAQTSASQRARSHRCPSA